MIIDAINEVQHIVEDETCNVDPNDTLVTPLLFPSVKIEVQLWAMEIGVPEYDDVFQEFGTLSLDFSKITLSEVYGIQHATATEIRIHENTLAYQDTKK